MSLSIVVQAPIRKYVTPTPPEYHTWLLPCGAKRHFSVKYGCGTVWPWRVMADLLPLYRIDFHPYRCGHSLSRGRGLFRVDIEFKNSDTKCFVSGQQTWWPLSRPCPAMCGPKLDDYTESRVLRLRFQNAVPRLLQLYSDIRAGLLSET